MSRSKRLSGGAAANKLRSERPSADLGTPPSLEWIDLADLMIDRRYQRVMGRKNLRHVNRIVRHFSWAHYQPIVVTESGERFAVIDGQHRYEAAKKHPLVKALPCYVVDAPDVAAQAAIFISANSTRIAVSRIHKFWAAHAAGEAPALAIERLCAAAGVEIARGPLPRPAPALKTIATFTLEKLLPLGEAAIGTALRVLATAQPESPDVFRSATIAALVRIVASEPAFDETAAIARLAEIDLAAEIGRAQVQRATGGGGIEQAMETLLRRRLAAATRRKAA